MENLHTHTTYADGKDSPEEMVIEAIARGFTTLGFSEHAPDSIGDCCYAREESERYIAEIAQLREKYRDRIRILTGLEKDSFSDIPSEPFDYIIGSVHYLSIGDDFACVDAMRDMTLDAIDRFFYGDPLALAEAYYKRVSNVVELTDADIIGHFDLLTKFNEIGETIPTVTPRYIKAALNAIDALLPKNRPFEINTGAMARGYRTVPYPSYELTRYIAKRGGQLILTSDCHDKTKLDFGFYEVTERLREMGIYGSLISADELLQEIASRKRKN